MTNKEAAELVQLVKEQSEVIYKMVEVITTLVQILRKPSIVVKDKE